MKISIADLQLLLAYLAKNTSDVAVHVSVEPGYCTFRFGTPSQDVVTVKLFEADAALQAKISSETYLRYLVK